MSKSQYDLVREFHNAFGLEYQGPPRKLSQNEQKFRIKCLREELLEYEEAVQLGDMEGELDALIDLVYFSLGTAHRCGYDFDTGFNRVHFSNMQKEIDTKAQRRDFKLEITKPAGWIPPDLSSLVMPYRAPINSELVQTANYCGLVTIDGPDSSGKSSLARRIVEMTKGEYIHLTWTPALEQVMDDYRTGALTYAAALAKEKVVVLERPFLSHLVYSEVYRNGELMLDDVIANWAAIIDDNVCADILALPSSRKRWFELYVEMTVTREELYAGFDDSKMKQVYDLFLSHAPEFEGAEFSTSAIYDMFSMIDPVNIDNWISHNVLSKLNSKG